MATRYVGETMLKDPDAVIPAGIDWTNWLADNGGTSIQTAVWSVTGGSGLVTASPTISQDGLKTFVRVSGGVVSSTLWHLTCHVTDDLGNEDDRSIPIIVKER